MEVSQRCGRKMLHLVSGSRPWILPNFLDQRVKFLKNRKMKNAPGFLIVFRVIKKSDFFQKKYDFFVFCWFSRPLSGLIRYKWLFENCILAPGKCHENRKCSRFFVRRPWICIPETMKTAFLFFFTSEICNAILLWQQCCKTTKIYPKTSNASD